MMRTSRFVCALISLSALPLFAAVPKASAQSHFPEKPITLISTFPAGGPVDTAAQAIAVAAKKYLPQPIEVVNRSGGAGTVGTAEALGAKPDGYTLAFSAMGALAIQPHLLQVPYGSPDDYTPIINVITNPACLAVRSDAPWKTAQEFFAHVKANPGKVRIGNLDPGSVLHLCAEQLSVMAGVQVQHVHFTSGPEGLKALLDGHLDALSQHNGLVFPAHRDGKARILGVFEEKRNSAMLEVPTFKEMGYDITLAGYLPIVGPKGLPPKVASTLHEALRKAMEDPAFTQPMKSKGYETQYQGSEDIRKRLARDFTNNAGLLAAMKIKKSGPDFPAGPIEIVVPFGAGSNVEKLLRMTIPYLQKEVGERISMGIRTGEGGAKGTSWLAKATPDGHYLGFVPPRPILVSPRVAKVPYAMSDFVPVAQAGVFRTGIVVPESSRWRTLKDLLVDAGQNPDKYVFATGGEFSLAHLAMEAVKQACGVKIKHLAFENGPAAMKGVLEGKADMAMTDLQAQFGKDGKTRLLAIATEARVPEWPDVPTLKELGYDLVFDVWQGLIAPKGTPPKIIEKLEAAMKKILAMPEFQKAVTSGTGATVAFLGSKEWAAKWEREDKAFADVLQRLGIGKP